jgi:hypothetical protein
MRKKKKNHTFLLFLEIGFRKYTLTQKWKQRELGFLDESSERERERERRVGVWNNKGFGFSLHTVCLGPSLYCVGFYFIF